MAGLERALYDDRVLVRTLCMRRTMFVVPVELVPVVQAACAGPLVAAERRRLVQLLEANGITVDGAAWLKEAEAETLAELEEWLGDIRVTPRFPTPLLKVLPG